MFYIYKFVSENNQNFKQTVNDEINDDSINTNSQESLSNVLVTTTETCNSNLTGMFLI